MDAILDWGVSLILWLQSLGTWLIAPMRFFTFLGTEQFYLLIAPALLWCVDTGWGLRMGLALTFSGSLNFVLKLVFHSPRPYWYDARVQALSSETSFGMPSGHAQNAVAVWGVLADTLRRPWAWAVAIALMFFIGLSRIYLGVHFPGDVIGGWAAGVVVLWLILRGERSLKPWLERSRVSSQILAILAVSLILIAFGALTRVLLGKAELPADWVNLANRAPGGKPIEPYALSGLVTSAASFFGLAWGGVLLKQRGWFNAGGTAWKRGVRYLIGVAGVLVLYTLLGVIFPHGETLGALILRYLRYALIGLWIAYFAPLLFIRLRLGETAN